MNIFKEEFKRLVGSRLTYRVHTPSLRCRDGVLYYIITELLVCLFHLIVFSNAKAQWKPLLRLGGEINSIYFLDLPGPPRVGFVGIVNLIFKTTDGGQTWREIDLPRWEVDGIVDFTFKDSLTGWLAASGIGGPDRSGCYKTTDGGNSWTFCKGSESDATGIYYDKKTDGLFLATYGSDIKVNGYGGWDGVSWDEGTTWSGGITNPAPCSEGGFAFSNDNNGVLASCDGCGVLWQRTIDGGKTWNALSMDSAVWQPLAISGTQTYFANTEFGHILRTDDSWNTWKVIYTFSWPPTIPLHTGETSGSSCIRGDMTNLFVTTGSGCFRSTDQGLTWNYLCGQPSYRMERQRFFVRDNYVYVQSADRDRGTLWMLDLDSMQNFDSKIESQFDDGTKRTTVKAGDTTNITFRPEMDSLVGVDSAHLVVRFDADALNLLSYKIPVGWSAANSVSQSGLLDLWLTNTGAVPLPDPILEVTFGTALSTASTIVTLDSAHLYGRRLNCDCSALSVAAPDSVEIDFTGCEDSVLLGFMHSGLVPFRITSIQPNPARAILQVNLAREESTEPVTYELLDALGAERLRGNIAASTTSLEVSSLPSGVYYLRIFQDGFVQTRRVVIER